MGVSLEGHIDVPSDRLSAVTEALGAHIALSRAEPGCEHFDVTPDTDIAGRFRVSERFTTRAAFDAHQARAAASDWGRISAGLSRDYRVTETD